MLYTFNFYIFKLLTINSTHTSKISDFSLLRKPLVTTIVIIIVYKPLFFKSLTLISQKIHIFRYSSRGNVI